MLHLIRQNSDEEVQYYIERFLHLAEDAYSSD